MTHNSASPLREALNTTDSVVGHTENADTKHVRAFTIKRTIIGTLIGLAVGFVVGHAVAWIAVDVFQSSAGPAIYWIVQIALTGIGTSLGWSSAATALLELKRQETEPDAVDLIVEIANGSTQSPTPHTA